MVVKEYPGKTSDAMKDFSYLFRWRRSNPLIWFTFAIITLCILFSSDYTEQDVQLIGLQLEEAPELHAKAKRRGKYITLKSKGTFNEYHLDGPSYDGLINRKALLDLETGDQLTVGLRKPGVFHLSFNELLGHLEPLTLSDASNTYLSLDRYNDARHRENRIVLVCIGVLVIILYLGMKSE